MEKTENTNHEETSHQKQPEVDSQNNNNQDNNSEIKLLLYLHLLIELFKRLLVLLHMEKLLRFVKAKNLNAWDNVKHEIIYNKGGLNPRIEHVTNFPKFDELKSWAEAEKFDDLKKFFYRVQTEYNMMADEFGKMVMNDLIDCQNYLQHNRDITSWRLAVPRREKYLKEVSEELIRAKKSLEQLKKTHTKNSSEVKFVEKEVKRLTLIQQITVNEIKRLKEDYERGIETGRAMRTYHYKNMAKAERIWDNLVTILFNFIWLEDQWKTACEEVGKPEMFDKAFKNNSMIIDANTKVFICLSQGWFAGSTIGLIRQNHGKLEDKPKYTQNSERQELTIFDENDTHRKGAFRQIMKTKQTIFTNILEYLQHTQQIINDYNENAERNYNNFDLAEDKSIMIKWMRQKLGMPQKYGIDDKVPNTYTTDFLLPYKIDRAENPHNNPDISPYEIKFDDNSMNILHNHENKFSQRVKEISSYSPNPSNIRQIKGKYDSIGNFIPDPNSNLHMTAFYQEDNVSYDVDMDEIDFYNQNNKNNNRLVETVA